MTHQRPRAAIAALLLVALLTATFARWGVPGAAAVTIADYGITNLGGLPPDGTYINPYDINDAGTVVGNGATVAAPNAQAVRRPSAGPVEALGLPTGVRSSTAYAVNEGGKIVGFMQLDNFDTRAFLYPPLVPADVLTDLGLLPGFTSASAIDINNQDTVVGYDTDSTATIQEAFLWTQGGGLQAIPNTIGGTNSAAAAINETGQVVGSADDSDGNSHAFLWTSAGGMTVLTPLFSYAAGINEDGVVAGQSYTDTDGWHVFLWTKAGGLVDLGVPLVDYTDSVTVTAINDLGQITGYASNSAGVTHAFVWLPSVGFVDLGAFGGRVGNAFGINNKGQIVVYTQNPDALPADRNRGLLLTPQGDTTPPTTTATPSGTAGNAGWFRSDVTVNLAATDNPGGFGVARITYSATGAQPIPATNVIGNAAAPIITAEGETTLSFFATDNATNQESPAKTLTVRIDKTPPALTTTLSAASAVPGDTIGITVKTSETLAGPPTVTVSGICVATTSVTVSAGPGPDTYTASYTIPAGTGACTVTVSASGSDVAGNPSTGGTATFASLGSPPDAAVAPASLDFGNQLVGTTGTAKQITVTNTGGRPLVFSGVTFGGANPGDFTIAYNSCAGSQVPGQSCVIAVAFAPTSVGAKSASLVIADNASSSPQQVALTGTGKVGTFQVAASAAGSGTVSPAGTTTYPAGSVATYTAAPNDGQVFLGWTLDGVYVGFASPLTFTVNGDRTLVATFAARPTFTDVPASDADYQAITFLAAMGIVNPNGVNGTHQFQPNADVKRAEVAAFIARVFGWQKEFHANAFPDRCDAQGQNCVDDELWNDVAALQDYGIVGGYTDQATCDSAGAGAPCYLPRDPVKRVQVISIIARAFIKTPDLRPTGFWDRMAADAGQYTNVPDSGTQRSDLTTYRANAGAVPGETAASTFPNPEGPGSRRFVVAALYQAFAAVYGVDNVP